MRTNTIHDIDLHDDLREMTGAVDLVEATFTPWDDDQAAELDALVSSLSGYERLDLAAFGDDD